MSYVTCSQSIGPIFMADINVLYKESLTQDWVNYHQGNFH